MPSGTYLRPSVGERFWSKVDKTDTCWLWTASVSPEGYGRFLYENKPNYAHRMAYILCKGKISKGLALDHLCRVRHCVNPEHLEAVTCKENVLRGVGIPAVNARKTHCIHGHPFYGENLYIRPDGNRGCNTCQRKRAKEATIRNKRS